MLIIGTFMASLASFYFKKSTTDIGLIGFLKKKTFYAGVILYIVSSIMTLWLLQRLPYSVVLPMGGISYIWTLLISHKFLGERMKVSKIAGVVFIITGVLFLSMSRLG
jgi:drug/metabolite transporter (DMT)-like permease